MNGGSLSGRTILVVEDEPLIALDIVDGLKAAGATVFGAHTVREVCVSLITPTCPPRSWISD